MLAVLLAAQNNIRTEDRSWGWFYLVGVVVLFGGILLAVRMFTGKKDGEENKIDLPGGENTLADSKSSNDAPDVAPADDGNPPADDGKPSADDGTPPADDAE